MIVLEFDNVEFSDMGDDPKKWTDELFFGAFVGNQFFKIDDADFSADYPILGFARELNAICFRLKRGSGIEEYVDPEYEHPFFLQFQLQDDWVLVSSLRLSDHAVVASARVHCDELCSAASKYLDRVVSYCAQHCPEIKSSEVIRNWLSDFSIPGYQGTL